MVIAADKRTSPRYCSVWQFLFQTDWAQFTVTKIWQKMLIFKQNLPPWWGGSCNRGHWRRSTTTNMISLFSSNIHGDMENVHFGWKLDIIDIYQCDKEDPASNSFASSCWWKNLQQHCCNSENKQVGLSPLNIQWLRASITRMGRRWIYFSREIKFTKNHWFNLWLGKPAWLFLNVNCNWTHFFV